MEISKYKQAMKYLLDDNAPLKTFVINPDARLVDNDPRPQTQLLGLAGGGSVERQRFKFGSKEISEFVKNKKEVTSAELINELKKIDPTKSIDAYYYHISQLKKDGILDNVKYKLEKVFPNVVAEHNNGYKAVRYELLVPLLIEAIKELKAEVDLLKSAK